jgi:uncharacterized heparinase superfamily protein
MTKPLQHQVKLQGRILDVRQNPDRKKNNRVKIKAASKQKQLLTPKPSLIQRIGEHPLFSVLLSRSARIQQLVIIPPDPWAGQTTLGRDIVQDRFRFVGQTFVARAHQWHPEDAHPDWLTELHSFEWLRDLRALGGDQARRTARLMVTDWLQHFKRWDSLAWRPDLVGARLAAWIGLHDFFLASADDGYRAAVFDSIQKQSRYLTRVLPGHLRGSRLITALRGQIYACLALPQSQPRLFQALSLLHDEINRQILPDGGHIERNPTTHTQVLRHLIDIRAALRCAGLAIPESISQAIHAMATTLRFYCHGDGKLTQMNGGTEGDHILIDTILQQAHANTKPAISLPHTGYERLSLGRSVLIMDVGTPPMVGYDSHIHAAPLSFEFSVARERLIINCGHGGALSKRSILSSVLRHTAAHSVAAIADTNSVELRPEGGVGRHPRTIHLHHEQSADHLLIVASHDGYHSNLGVIHTRQLYLADQGEDLRGEDAFVGSAGHPLAIRFHLHPDVRASLTGQSGVLLRTRSGAGWRFRASGAHITLEDSVYVSRVGEAMKKTTQIVLTTHTEDKDKTVKWRLTREKKKRVTKLEPMAFNFGQNE